MRIHQLAIAVALAALALAEAGWGGAWGSGVACQAGSAARVGPARLSLRGGAAAQAGLVTAIETKEAFDLVLQEAGDKLVVVDFTATWCGPCQRIAPTIDRMASELREVIFLKVDVDDNQETAGACGVECMPTFQLFKNGEKIGQVEGADEGRLRAIITEKGQ